MRIGRILNEKSFNYWNKWSGRFISGRIVIGKGYEVYGLMRRKSVTTFGNIEHKKDE